MVASSTWWWAGAAAWVLLVAIAYVCHSIIIVRYIRLLAEIDPGKRMVSTRELGELLARSPLEAIGRQLEDASMLSKWPTDPRLRRARIWVEATRWSVVAAIFLGVSLPVLGSRWSR